MAYVTEQKPKMQPMLHGCPEPIQRCCYEAKRRVSAFLVEAKILLCHAPSSPRSFPTLVRNTLLMVHLYPVPDAEGLAKTKALYLNRFGRTLTDEEAYAILNPVMRFLYLRSLPPEVTPEEAVPGRA